MVSAKCTRILKYFVPKPIQGLGNDVEKRWKEYRPWMERRAVKWSPLGVTQTLHMQIQSQGGYLHRIKLVKNSRMVGSGPKGQIIGDSRHKRGTGRDSLDSIRHQWTSRT